MSFPKAEDILAASQRIASLVHHTPVLTSISIDKMVGAKLFFKCENLQKVGAFKYRGATNTLLQLSPAQLKQGVATHSSGNHAQALALAAQLHDTAAYIVMPSNASESKKEAVLGYGAKIIECEPTLDARETTLKQIVAETKAHFIHPYNDITVIEGQATAAKELIDEIPQLDYLLAPVGGGGLLSGSALSAYYFSPSTKVIGTEPTGADDAYRSFNSDIIISSINPKTIADGLLTSLGTKTFPIIQKHVLQILTVDDDMIVEAMRLIWQRMKIIVEASAAVPLAALMQNAHLFKGKRVGIVLSGGNIDLNRLPFKA